MNTFYHNTEIVRWMTGTIIEIVISIQIRLISYYFRIADKKEETKNYCLESECIVRGSSFSQLIRMVLMVYAGNKDQKLVDKSLSIKNSKTLICMI
jgi:hypothetical protein